MLGGFGEKNYGNSYRNGNRVYSSDYIAACLTAHPVGSMGGHSHLYLVRANEEFNTEEG